MFTTSTISTRCSHSQMLITLSSFERDFVQVCMIMVFAANSSMAFVSQRNSGFHLEAVVVPKTNQDLDFKISVIRIQYFHLRKEDSSPLNSKVRILILHKMHKCSQQFFPFSQRLILQHCKVVLAELKCQIYIKKGHTASQCSERYNEGYQVPDLQTAFTSLQLSTPLQ